MNLAPDEILALVLFVLSAVVSLLGNFELIN